MRTHFEDNVRLISLIKFNCVDYGVGEIENVLHSVSYFVTHPLGLDRLDYLPLMGVGSLQYT